MYKYGPCIESVDVTVSVMSFASISTEGQFWSAEKVQLMFYYIAGWLHCKPTKSEEYDQSCRLSNIFSHQE